jgi:uncharacterized membrane protein
MTYLGAPGTTPRRLAAVLALRLTAFALAALAVARPFLGSPEARDVVQRLLLVIDCSESMTITDESQEARWDFMLRQLRDSAPALDRLRNEENVAVEFYRFARDTAPFDPADPGKPDGKRTDVGAMLHQLGEQGDGRTYRGLVVLTDGRNNGIQGFLPMKEVARWRERRCPVHTVLFGNPKTPTGLRDVAVTAVTPEPSPVPIKGDLAVRATIESRGFGGSRARVRLLLDDQEVPVKLFLAGKETPEVGQTVTLSNNQSLTEVRLRTTAPAKPGEVKVVVRVDPLPGERNTLNNEMGTYLTVTKEGVSVLLVDKQRAWEPQLLCDVIGRDKRIHLYVVWLRGDEPPDARAGDLFQFDKRKYDVVILGDVTAAQLRAVNKEAPEAIARLVDGGAGFLMLGGFSSFGDGDWKGTPIERLLPVDLSVTGQVEGDVQMLPTEPGLRLFGYVLSLADGKRANEEVAWKALPPLNGMSKLRERRDGIESVLARSARDEPILVARNSGKGGRGRTLAFAGDTTYLWVRDPEGQEKHARFWRGMVGWLAHQDEAEGSVWIRPDKDARGLLVGETRPFSVGVRSKGGLDIKEARFPRAEVVGPKGRQKIDVVRENGEDRGVFKPQGPGEYTVEVDGVAKDPSGGEVRGTARCRFLVYDTDAEMSDWAADDKFLMNLAQEGRGQFVKGARLPEFLERLPRPPAAGGRDRQRVWPDWRGQGRSPFLATFFVLFVAALGGEWLLRRRWGMV